VAAQYGDALNVDDNNPLEYAFARNVGKGAFMNQNEPFTISHQLKTDRPDAIVGQVDWVRVDARRVVGFAVGGEDPIPADWPAPLRSLYNEVQRYEAGDLAGVARAYRSHPHELGSPYELAMVAEALAQAKDESALALIDRLRAFRPAEAEACRALLLARQDKAAEAGAALQQVYALARTDPWPLPEVLGRALDLGVRIAVKDKATGEMLFRELDAPFAIGNMDGARLWSRLRIGFVVDFQKHCVAALAPFERSAPWLRWLLERRLACYAATSNPLARGAERDLRAFVASTPSELGAGLLDVGAPELPPAPPAMPDPHSNAPTPQRREPASVQGP
jgi:hypothetical protein